MENLDGERCGRQLSKSRFKHFKQFLKAFEHAFGLNNANGRSEIIAHSDLYPPSTFITNDTVIICCNIWRSITQPGFKAIEPDTQFNDIIWKIYSESETDNCVIEIGEETLKVNY